MERDGHGPAGLGEGGEVSGVAYGVALRGRLPAAFGAYLLPPAAGVPPADSLEVSYRRIDDLPEVEETWVEEHELPAGPLPGCRFALFREPDGFGLTVSCAGRGLFRCSRRSIRIEWTPAGTGAPHLFSYALPLWLETRGVPVLHGSVVRLGDPAVGFLGASGAGKSVIAAGLVRLGCDLVADDGLVVRRDGRGGWLAFHGPPQVHLWPSGLGHLEVDAHGLPRVHEMLDKRRLRLGGEAGRSALEGVRLAAVYLLERRPETGGGAISSRLARREALVRLLEHSVAAAPAAALGLSRQRLETLAAVTRALPVRCLSLPSGADSAARVREAVARDLAAAGG